MFSQECVKNSVQGVSASGSGGSVHRPGQTSTLGRNLGTLPRDGHCNRRYASYWNAFLFTKNKDCVNERVMDAHISTNTSL